MHDKLCVYKVKGFSQQRDPGSGTKDSYNAIDVSVAICSILYRGVSGLEWVGVCLQTIASGGDKSLVCAAIKEVIRDSKAWPKEAFAPSAEVEECQAITRQAQTSGTLARLCFQDAARWCYLALNFSVSLLSELLSIPLPNSGLMRLIQQGDEAGRTVFWAAAMELLKSDAELKELEEHAGYGLSAVCPMDLLPRLIKLFYDVSFNSGFQPEGLEELLQSYQIVIGRQQVIFAQFQSGQEVDMHSRRDEHKTYRPGNNGESQGQDPKRVRHEVDALQHASAPELLVPARHEEEINVDLLDEGGEAEDIQQHGHRPQQSSTQEAPSSPCVAVYNDKDQDVRQQVSDDDTRMFVQVRLCKVKDECRCMFVACIIDHP